MATKHLRSSLTLVTALVSVMCIGNAAAKGPPPPPTPVTLTAPDPGVVIVQNDSTLNGFCIPDANRGLGFRITFDWTDYQPATKVKYYTLQLHHGSASPISVDTMASTYDYVACNAFVVDFNLTGWYWTVTVVGKGPAVQNPEQRPFSFASCRLSDGVTACNAPP